MKMIESIRIIFLLLYLREIVSLCPPTKGRLWVDFPKDLHLTWTKLSSCNSSEDCIDAGLVLRDIRPQILPVLVQLGQRVRLQLPRNSYLFEVSESEFLSCNPQSDNKPQRDLKSVLIRPDMIERQQNKYILVRRMAEQPINSSLTEETVCSEGLRRMNISWAGNSCTHPLRNHRFACSRNGWCLSHNLYSAFKCWCCEDYWSEDGTCPPRQNANSALEPGGRAKTICDCKKDMNAECCSTEECHSHPCRNGGICRNRFPDEGGGYECICALGFSGVNCEKTELATCDLSHCPLMNHCFQNTEGGTECVPDDIKEQLPSCESSLCFNQAECYIVRQTPRCFCSYLFEGAYCRRGTGRLIYNAKKGRVYFGVATFACAFGTLVAVLVICRVHTWKCYVVPKNRRRGDYSAWGAAVPSGGLTPNANSPSPRMLSDETSRFSTISSRTRPNLYTDESEELMMQPTKNTQTSLDAESDMLVSRA